NKAGESEIGERNVEAVKEVLEQLKIPIIAKDKKTHCSSLLSTSILGNYWYF
ncbi:MAG TPA: hypothetical protein GX522_06100, partial [Firmicutes bacterium]|nr:hypothetical protein [Bacillota bacterium]